MGQIIGTPGLHSSVGPFGRLPKKALESIWASYNLLGDTWGLSIEDLKMIVEGADYFISSVVVAVAAALKLTL